MILSRFQLSAMVWMSFQVFRCIQIYTSVTLF